MASLPFTLSNQATARIVAALAEQGPWTTPSKLGLAARTWDRVYESHTRTFTPEGWSTPYEIGEPFPAVEGETQAANAARAAAFNAAFKVWQSAKGKPFELSIKQRDCCKTAVVYAIEHADKVSRAAVFAPDKFTLEIFAAFEIADTDE